MSMMSYRIGAGVAGLATAAAVAVFAAPGANATVDSVSISGTAPYTINTSYTLTANLSGASIGLLVYWSDNGTNLTPAGKVPWPIGYSSIDWKPTTAGQHLLTASQGGNTKTIIVNVTDPSQPGGGTGGSGGGGGTGGGGTGSAGSALGGLLGGLTGSAGS
ncbi:hypothetical protein [Nocardia aurantiaca]|uniref:Uncharacterized protein n=1 Tax=Nocardia aurantiaca TaxID=2675850 RepID=A0A6I3L2N4_9NOCA|nr:hypothetical protein [Nocardia aurantiaca]MTE16562.1 hypothetical protein [Nocardia aurantiaca]